MRPTDLARAHGLSPQAVRNYEQDGFLPPAERTPSGYRVYTEVHAAALNAYLALVAAHGYRDAGRIMRATHAGALDEALAVIDHGHARLIRDRATLDLVQEAIGARPDRPPPAPGTWSVGELARRLDVTPATLRKWEAAGILTPARDRPGGRRVFRAADVRDAELAHLLRRGRYPLSRIAVVLAQVRTAGSPESLTRALTDWQRRLTTQGTAMLTAAAALSHYLATRTEPPADHPPADHRPTA